MKQRFCVSRCCCDAAPEKVCFVSECGIRYDIPIPNGLPYRYVINGGFFIDIDEDGNSEGLFRDNTGFIFSDFDAPILRSRLIRIKCECELLPQNLRYNFGTTFNEPIIDSEGAFETVPGGPDGPDIRSAVCSAFAEIWQLPERIEIIGRMKIARAPIIGPFQRSFGVMSYGGQVVGAGIEEPTGVGTGGRNRGLGIHFELSQSPVAFFNISVGPPGNTVNGLNPSILSPRGVITNVDVETRVTYVRVFDPTSNLTSVTVSSSGVISADSKFSGRQTLELPFEEETRLIPTCRQVRIAGGISASLHEDTEITEESLTCTFQGSPPERPSPLCIDGTSALFKD